MGFGVLETTVNLCRRIRLARRESVRNLSLQKGRDIELTLTHDARDFHTEMSG